MAWGIDQETIDNIVLKVKEIEKQANEDNLSLSNQIVQLNQRIQRLEVTGNSELQGDLEETNMQVEELRNLVKRLNEILIEISISKNIIPKPQPPKPEEKLKDIMKEVEEKVKAPRLVKSKEMVEDETIGYCLGCRQPRKMLNIEERETSRGPMNVGDCETCGRKIYRKIKKK